MWLAAPLLLLGGAAEPACLDLSGEIAVEGTIASAMVEETSGQPDGSVKTEERRIWYILPDKPACAMADGGEPFFFARAQVWSELGDVMQLVEQAEGRRVRLTGEGFAGHTAHHYAPLMLEAQGLATLDGDPIPEHAS